MFNNTVCATWFWNPLEYPHHVICAFKFCPFFIYLSGANNLGLQFQFQCCLYWLTSIYPWWWDRLGKLSDPYSLYQNNVAVRYNEKVFVFWCNPAYGTSSWNLQRYFNMYDTIRSKAAHIFLLHFNMPYFICVVLFYLLLSVLQNFQEFSSSFSLIYAVFAGI